MESKHEGTPLLNPNEEEVDEESASEDYLSDGYPNDVLTKWELNAWNEQKKWSKVANKKRSDEVFWRKAKLQLSVSAVVLQTLATQIQDGQISLPFGKFIPFPLCGRKVCSIAGAGLLTLIPYVNDQLSEDKIADRADSRLVGEELLSEIWKSLAGVSPYEKRDDMAAEKFNERINNIIKAEAEIGGDAPRYGIHPICNLPVAETEKDLVLTDKEKMPRFGLNTGTGHQNRKELYMHERAEKSAKRRKEKAKGHEELAKFWNRAEISLTFGSALIGIILNTTTSDKTDFGLWAVVFTTAAAAVASHITACRFVENKNDLYGVSMLLENILTKRKQKAHIQENILTKRKQKAHIQGETQKNWEEFVNDFEDTLLSQTRKWRASKMVAATNKAEQPLTMNLQQSEETLGSE